MKSVFSLFLVVVALLVSNSSSAQKILLPVQCPDLREKLLLIQTSFSEMEKWKKDSIKSIAFKKWKTEFLMCGQAAIIFVSERGGSSEIQLSFQFDKLQYTATPAQVELLAGKIRKGINEVFGKTFVESYWKSEDDEMYSASDSYTWKVNGSGNMQAKKRIVLNYPFVETHLTISFYYIRDK